MRHFFILLTSNIKEEMFIFFSEDIKIKKIKNKFNNKNNKIKDCFYFKYTLCYLYIFVYYLLLSFILFFIYIFK